MQQTVETDNNKNSSDIKTLIIVDDINNLIIRDSHEFKLDPLIFKLLDYLRQHSEQIVNRQQLMENVWQSAYTSDTAINRSISELRKALGGQRNSIIKTLSKKGYCFSLPDNVSIEDKRRKTEQPPLEPKQLKTEPKPPARPQQSDLLAQLNQQPLTQNTNKTSQSKNLTIAGAGILLALIITAVLSNIFIQQQVKTAPNNIQNASYNQMGSPLPATTQSKPAINIYVEKTTNITKEQISSLAEQALHQQIINAVIQTENIQLLGQQPERPSKTANQFTLKSSLSKIDQQLSISLQLIEHQTQQYRYSTVLTIRAEDINTANQQLSKQIEAVLYLTLLNPVKGRHYLSALNPLTHDDIYQLTLASENLDSNVAAGNTFAYEVLTKLNNKYPNTPEILGLLSRGMLKVDTQKPFIEHDKHLQLEYANQALAQDPQNLDAMLSLYYYNAALARSKAAASRLANDLIRIHPQSPKAWRAQLFQFIKTKSPCNNIAQFVKTIPQGIFKPQRLWVIDQMLQNCMTQKPQTSILSKANSQPNDRLNLAIYNNMYLFNISDDAIVDVFEKRSRFKSNKFFQIRKLKMSYITQNHIAAQSTSQELVKNNVRYWTDAVSLLQGLYSDSSSINPNIIDNLPYNYLTGEMDLLYVSYINKMTNQGHITKDVMKSYLIKRPKFIVNVENHKQATALMMAEYLAGKVNQSRSTARLLYEKLEQYRQQDQASFNFWALGRFHLLARSYCGQKCQTTSERSYLESTFSANHTWWLDDSTLMQNALAPWQQSSLVQAYLAKVTQDQQRIKDKLGL